MAHFVPLGKLLAVGLKLLAKPVASVIKGQAKTHPMLHDSCATLGQGVHKLVVRIFRLARDEEGGGLIKALPHERAVERGAELVGELFVVSVVGGVTISEVIKAGRERAELEAKKEAKRDEKMRLQLQHDEAFLSRIVALEESMRRVDSEIACLSAALVQQQQSTAAADTADPTATTLAPDHVRLDPDSQSQ
ncbi:OPA3-like protein [Porphyridium purpureum]|uniref:OPA3-like protein n=1 Tax=Porphyridium purpureum TaxID=35688 RepID=A0A5J4Z024_PORPP|nr:OPA3-like protein [Porphyridium purpureum]|eukprot:POR1186..scf208_2